MTENGKRSGAGAVAFLQPRPEHPFHQFMILAHRYAAVLPNEALHSVFRDKKPIHQLVYYFEAANTESFNYLPPDPILEMFGLTGLWR